MSDQAERHEFQTEVRELLDLMIHSLYSHKDIFLRELVSNASDALDKVRFEVLSRPELTPVGEPEITLEVDAEARTLAVHDNGIGMTRQELVENLGTIARSGTREFLRAVREAQAATAPELIGQFGVGFYSSFMVSDRITVVTRRAGTEEATRWESTGDGGYSLGPADRAAAGTTVTLHLKPKDEEDGLKDYTQGQVLTDIVKRYSDFVAYPIRLKGETLNSMKAIWARGKDEVSEDEHREFYKHISHDWNDPLEHLSVHLEGGLEARALLYIPSKAPFDLHDRDGGHGLSLYVKRVFIMDDWRELLPPYLRFVRGVVASDDLSLNVSREILQKDRQVQVIRKHLVRRIIGALKDMKEQRAEKYRTFWTEFGAVLKEGLVAFEEGQDKLLELVLAPSTDGPAPTSLGDYVKRMKDGQGKIYYVTAASREAGERSPHLEAFRARGYEVLFFLDPVDELWLRLPREVEGKTVASVTEGAVDLGSEAEKKEGEPAREETSERFKDLLMALRAALQDEIKDVRLSGRLTSSPACLVGEAGDLSPHLQELLRRSGQAPPKVKRVLELNPAHPLVTRLQAFHAAHPADERFTRYAELLHGQAILAEGGALPDPAAFSRRLAELLVEATEAKQPKETT
jgi:molecular chaperone HtpG